MKSEKPSNYVSAKKDKKLTPMPLSEISMVSEDKTLPDYRNRSAGFLLYNVPYFICVAVSFLILRKYFLDSDIFSLTSSAYFCIIVSGLWSLSYILYFTIQSEFSNLLETIYKWRMLRDEHKTRWEYYKKINFEDN